jgi:hypothetical protein
MLDRVSINLSVYIFVVRGASKTQRTVSICSNLSVAYIWYSPSENSFQDNLLAIYRIEATR